MKKYKKVENFRYELSETEKIIGIITENRFETKVHIQPYTKTGVILSLLYEGLKDIDINKFLEMIKWLQPKN